MPTGCIISSKTKNKLSWFAQPRKSTSDRWVSLLLLNDSITHWGVMMKKKGDLYLFLY